MKTCRIDSNTDIFSIGRRVHQSCQRCVRLHAGEGARRRRRGFEERTPGDGVDVSVPELQLHGQRDQLPSETVPRRGHQGQVLGQVYADRQPTELRDAANQQRARILHGDLRRTEGTNNLY